MKLYIYVYIYIYIYKYVYIYIYVCITIHVVLILSHHRVEVRLDGALPVLFFTKTPTEFLPKTPVGALDQKTFKGS